MCDANVPTSWIQKKNEMKINIKKYTEKNVSRMVRKIDVSKLKRKQKNCFFLKRLEQNTEENVVKRKEANDDFGK